jgi:outer membrane protein assembly factor BamA
VHGEDRSSRDVIGQLTLYEGLRLPGFGNHALALRGSGGVAGGPGADQYHFEVGGASGVGGPLGIVDLGNGLFFPVRGYDTARRYGIYAWSASGEYRFPIRLVNRGAGLLPLHLDWLSGTLFFDAGNAWGPELDLRGYQNPRRDPLASVGGEVTARILPLWYAVLDLRLGLAFPLVEGDGPRAYLRLGSAF